MDFLNFLCADAPTGLWASIINWLNSGIANYALVIFVMTVLIKLVMLPFDFYNKYVSKKNMVLQQEIAPEINKINKLYANNPNLKNQKTAEVYKKHNYNVYGTCFGMIAYMALTMTIFFTLFSTLNAMSAYKITNEYNTLSATYEQVYSVSYDDYANIESELTQEEYATLQAEKAVVEKYGEIKSGFLWIKNIWRPDTGASVTLDYKEYLSQSKTKEADLSEEEYNKVMAPIEKAYDGWNGYFLLAVINGLLSLGSMYISELISKQKAKKKGLPYISTTNKSMMIIMPIIMALFTIFYNAAFGIYIVAGSLFSVVTAPLVTLVVEKVMENQAKKKESKKPSYSR